MPRFFLPDLDPGRPVIAGEDARHIGFALRMRPGESLTVCSGRVDYHCRIREITPDSVFLEILEESPCGREPTVELTLFQAMPKGDKLEQIVQKAVELGAARIVPVLTRRCISRPDGAQFAKKQQRLQKIAHAAAKQAGRGIIPEVADMLPFSRALEELGRQQLPVMLYESEGISLSQLAVPRTGTIGVLVGSEGGFDPEEAEQARNAGVQPVWLGPRILRCETAPVTALSLLMYLSGNL